MVGSNTKYNAGFLSPLTITIIYFVVAALWIFLTDRLLEFFISDPELLSSFQTYKGLFYVLVTTLGLYALIKIYVDQLYKKEEQLKGVEEVRATESRLIDVLFERIPVLITIYDPKLEEFEVNKEFDKVVGWSNEEVQEIDLFEECFPDRDVREEMIEFMKEPGLGWREFTLNTRDGKNIEVSWTNIRLTDDISVGIGVDMTEVKASQTQLRESRRLLENVFNSLKESVLLIDPESRMITECNEATEEIFGYTEEELVGRSTRILHVNDEAFKEFAELGRESLKKKGSFETEFMLQKKNGDIFHSEHTVTLVYNDSEEKEVERIVSVVRDISERKAHERELKEQQRRLLRSQQIGKIGDWQLNIATEEFTWSPMMYDIYERDPQKGPPSFEEIQHDYYGKDSEKHNEAIRKAAEKGQPIDLDLILHAGDQIKYIRCIALPVKNSEGEVVKLTGIVQDITDRKEAEREQRRLSDILQKSLNEIYLFDPDTLKIVYANEGAIQNIGYSLEELKEMTPLDIKPEYDRAEFEKKIRPLLKGEKDKIDFETVHRRSDGSTYPVEVHKQLIKAGDEPILADIVLDITERKAVEKALRRSEQRLEAITNNIPGVVFRYKRHPDGSDEMRFVSQGAENVWGYPPQEVMANNDIIWENILREDTKEVLKSIYHSARDLSKWQAEWRYRMPDGEIRWQEGMGMPRKLNDGSIVWDSIIRDITEEKQLKNQIVQSIIKGEDRERRRIAQELHDGIGQYLSASNMNLESIKPEVEKLPEKQQSRFQTSLHYLKKALSETRAISHNLMPGLLEDYGLEVAVETLLDNIRESAEVAIQYELQLNDSKLSDQQEKNIYRIIQEGVNNALQHSDCSSIRVVIEQTDGHISCRIEDDGKGASGEELREKQGMGLRSMKARTDAMSGSIYFDSQPGEGMNIRVLVPLKENHKTEQYEDH